MIKKLFLMAALLMPSLAYGANPTANLSVQIVPAGSAPAVPAGAKAAGFTTLAANYDFSQPLYATQSNWLGAWGSPPPSSGFQWYQVNNCGVGPTPPPASNISQTFDAVANKQVLDLHWPASSYVGAGNCNDNNMIIQQESFDGTSSTGFPPNVYIEAVTRLLHNNPAANKAGNEVQAVWQWTDKATQQGTAQSTERDMFNEFPNAGNPITSALMTNFSWGIGGTCSGNSVYCFGAGPSFTDASQYQKIGIRTTSDGSSDIQSCYYYNDVQQFCDSEKPLSRSGFNAFITRNHMILQCGNVPTDQDCYYQYVRIWSCANWETTQCNGKVLTGAP